MQVNRWTIARRFVQLSVLLLLASPALDLQFFEGNLAAASLFGLQLSDPLATLQILLLTGSLTSSLLVGVGVTLALYGLLGGRSFCGWVCPVHLLTDLGELLPGTKQLPIWSLDWKLPALALILLLSLLFGVPVFETLSPIGVAGRALSFGASSSLWLLLLILIAELVLVRRIWCRSLCPLGGFYALWGQLSPLAVRFLPERCTHCGDCQRLCFVPEVLDPSLSRQVTAIHAGDCTRCGACVGCCPENALKFGLRKPFTQY